METTLATPRTYYKTFCENKFGRESHSKCYSRVNQIIAVGKRSAMLGRVIETTAVFGKQVARQRGIVTNKMCAVQ